MADKTSGKTTKVAELTARKAAEEATLATLQTQAESKGAAIKALEEMAAADLAAVPVGDLERESRKQAGARLEAETLRIELKELQRRIAKQQAVIGATSAAIAEAERHELAHEADELLTELQQGATDLLGKVDRMQKLDLALRSRGSGAPVAGYWGGMVAGLQGCVADVKARRAKSYPYGPN
jgi:hypothetical protein